MAARPRRLSKASKGSKSSLYSDDYTLDTNLGKIARQGSKHFNKQKVLIIYTGGTIGMIYDKENDFALTPSTDYIRKELRNIEENEEADFPYFEVLEFETVIDSSDMTKKHWIQIATMIKENYYQFDGFVVLMGTDTMAYTASAISFMLKYLTKPVVFTGSMLPLVKAQSDARRNLLCSIEIAATTGIPEVCIFFHEYLYRGNRCKKIKSAAIDAFISPNFPPLATYGTSLVINEAVMRKRARKKKFKLVTNFDNNLLVIKLVPGFNSMALSCIFRADKQVRPKAVILELYGTGNLPGQQKDLFDMIQSAVKEGMILVICSQCVYGSVSLGSYSVGKKLKDIGALSALDMTVEAVSAKLAFLLGQPNTSTKEIKKLMRRDLRGELTLHDQTHR